MSVARSERRPRGELSRVLVVDDEPDIRELIDLTLSRMGLAADARRPWPKRAPALPKAVSTLPDRHAPAGWRRAGDRSLIAEHHPQMPVAVITAFGSTENAVAALKAGAFDYLAKPVALDQLRALVKSALRVPDGEVRGRSAQAADRPIGGDGSGPRADRQAGAQPGARLYLRRIG